MKQNAEIDIAEIITFANSRAFDEWLVDNFLRISGVWIKIAKKDSGIPSITSDEAVDVGLCWGWISGQRKSFDERYYLQKYVPRRSGSVWSQINVEKVKVLIESGRMRAPGLAEIEAAKADGRWEAAYVSQRNALPPPDLSQALALNNAASVYFNKLNKTERYAVILQLVKERTALGRATRLKKLIAVMVANENNR